MTSTPNGVEAPLRVRPLGFGAQAGSDLWAGANANTTQESSVPRPQPRSGLRPILHHEPRVAASAATLGWRTQSLRDWTTTSDLQRSTELYQAPHLRYTRTEER